MAKQNFIQQLLNSSRIHTLCSCKGGSGRCSLCVIYDHGKPKGPIQRLMEGKIQRKDETDKEKPSP